MRPSRLARSRVRTGAPVRFLIVAGLATVLLVGVGVLALGGSDEDPEPPQPEEEAPFTTTALADHDTSEAVVTRGPFCDAIDERQVEAVLGTVPDVLEWANGDEIELGNGTTDVVHEFGCSYAVPDVGVARAWVYAPPVDAQQAERLVRSAAKGAGCVAGDGPGFGTPTLALTCTTDGVERASYRGLFGDAWLVCEVDKTVGAVPDVLDEAGRWCVGVLKAAGG